MQLFQYFGLPPSDIDNLKPHINTLCIGNPGFFFCKEGWFDIRVGTAQCIIVQSNHNSDNLIKYPDPGSLHMKDMHQCIIKSIKHATVLQPGKRMKYVVTGFLSGKVHY